MKLKKNMRNIYVHPILAAAVSIILWAVIIAKVKSNIK